MWQRRDMGRMFFGSFRVLPNFMSSMFLNFWYATWFAVPIEDGALDVGGSQLSFLMSPHVIIILCFLSILFRCVYQFVLFTSDIFSNRCSSSSIVSRLKRSYSYQSVYDWNCSDSSGVRPGKCFDLQPLGIYFMEKSYTFSTKELYRWIVASRCDISESSVIE